MSECSNEFPNTDVFYYEIRDDVTSIVLLAIASVMTLVCIGIFVEELVFLQRIEYANESKLKKVATILGLFPVTMLTALISVLVPPSTILVDLIASCYFSVCFYTFVALTISYFGGDEKMLEVLADDKVRTSTGPCCCCCCCILRPITLTKRRLLFFKLCALQVAVVRPVLLFIAAILWTDGRYDRHIGYGSSGYLYITIITVISLLFSMYGTTVIYRASAERLRHYKLGIKFASLQILLVLLNVQNGVFGILSRYDLPACIGSRGPQVRGNSLQHMILVIESFLLCLLARKAYRWDETNVQPPEYNSDIITDKGDKPKNNAKVSALNEETHLENGTTNKGRDQQQGLTSDYQAVALIDVKSS